MADRTWNGVDARLWDEPWSLVTKLTMAFIISCCPNAHGVFDLPLGKLILVLSEDYKPKKVHRALDELERLGKIKRYRDKSVVWICSKWKRDPNRAAPTNKKGALTRIRDDFPEVLNDFAARYDIDLALLDQKLDRGSNLNQPKTRVTSNNVREINEQCTIIDRENHVQCSQTQRTTEPEPEPEPEVKDLSSDSGESAKRKSSKFSSDFDFDTELEKLEKRLEPNIAREWDQFKHMVAQQNKTKQVANGRLYKLLLQITQDIEEYNLNIRQVIHGFKAALTANAANTKYIRKAALSYRGDDTFCPQQPEPTPRNIGVVIRQPEGVTDEEF